MLWQLEEKSDRVTAMVLALGREVIRIICVYGPQNGRPDTEKVRFYDEMASKWDWKVLVKSSFL